MIAIILMQGWQNERYIENHVAGFAQVCEWLIDHDAHAALVVCRLEKQPVMEPCRLMPLGSHDDERSYKVWRTIATVMFPAAAGFYPPAVIPEEIINDHPDRLRYVLVNGCKQLRSCPNTNAYEKAFSALDLLMVTDIVMIETSRLAQYVLPSRTFYESWDGTSFSWTYPRVYFQLRGPLVEHPGECLESYRIYTRLAEKLGLVPVIRDEVQEAAGNTPAHRLAFGAQCRPSYTV